MRGDQRRKLSQLQHTYGLQMHFVEVTPNHRPATAAELKLDTERSRKGAEETEDSLLQRMTQEVDDVIKGNNTVDSIFN